MLEPSPEAVAAYDAEIKSHARIGARFYMECTPGYYNSEGTSGNRGGFFSNMYGLGPMKFFELLAAWRDEGGMQGLELQ